MEENKRDDLLSNPENSDVEKAISTEEEVTNEAEAIITEEEATNEAQALVTEEEATNEAQAISTEAAEQDASAPKKRGKKALAVGIGCAAAVAVIGVGFVAANRLLQNDTVKFLQYQGEFLEEKTEGFVESLKHWENIDTDMTISGKFLDASSDTLGIGSYLEGSSLVIKMKSNAKEEQALLNYLLTVQGTPILEYGMRMDEEEVAFAVPSVDENLYTGNIRAIYKNLTGVELEKLQYDAEEVRDILKPYLVDFTQSFTKKSLQVERGVANPYVDGMKVTEYAFVPDKEEIISYIEKIAKRMQDDEDMKNIYISFMLGYRTAMDMPSYEEAIENLLSRKEELASNLVDSEFSWKLGVQSDKVVYIQIMNMGMERFSYALTDESDATTEVYALGGETFTNRYTKKDGRVQGSISTATEEELSYDYNPKEMSKLGMYEGTYKLSLNTFDVDLTVDADGGDDSHIFNVADMVEVNIGTTKTSTATELSGTEVDINDWSEEDFMSYLDTIGASVQEIMLQMIGF